MRYEERTKKARHLCMFITFEGLDFSGKSTQVKLLSDRFSQEDFNVIVLREPGGTEIGEKIRKILLDKASTGMTDVSELFLFSASRSQLVEEVIKPALDGRMVVICDRYFDSTTAYQGWARGIPLETIRSVNQSASGGLVPRLTFFLDIPVSEVEKRFQRAKSNKDRMESNGKEFYEKAREGYLRIAKEEQRFRVIDGTKNADEIHEVIWKEVEKALADRTKT